MRYNKDNVEYKKFFKIRLSMKNFEKHIYKSVEISNNNKYTINSQRYKISENQNKIYTSILEIGIVKELRKQNIINEEEMIDIINYLKKKNKLEVEL